MKSASSRSAAPKKHVSACSLNIPFKQHLLCIVSRLQTARKLQLHRNYRPITENNSVNSHSTMEMAAVLSWRTGLRIARRESGQPGEKTAGPLGPAADLRESDPLYAIALFFDVSQMLMCLVSGISRRPRIKQIAG